MLHLRKISFCKIRGAVYEAQSFQEVATGPRVFTGGPRIFTGGPREAQEKTKFKNVEFAKFLQTTYE